MKILKAIAGAEFHLVPLPQALNCLRHFSCHWTHQVFENMSKIVQISLQSPNLYVLIQLRIELTKPQMHRPSFSRGIESWAAEALAVSNPLSFLYSFGPGWSPSSAMSSVCAFWGKVILCRFHCVLLVLLKKTKENGKIQGNPDLFGNGSRLSFQAKQCLPISSLRWGQGQNRNSCPWWLGDWIIWKSLVNDNHHHHHDAVVYRG